MNSNTKPTSNNLLFADSLINSVSDASFCVASDARLVYVNDAVCRLLEYPREELLALSLEHVDRDFQFQTWRQRWQLLQQQGQITVRSCYRTKSGQIVPLEITLTCILEQGQMMACALVHRRVEPILNGAGDDMIQRLNLEISQLEVAKTELSTTLSILRGTLDSAAYGIVSVSYEGEVLSYNRKFVEMWGIGEDLELSKESAECQRFFAERLRNPEVFRHSVWEVSRESDAESYDILQLKDGRVFAQYSKPQRLADQIIGRVWSIWDITQFKERTEAELQQTKQDIDAQKAIDEAKQLGELRSRFLSMLCHQFRSSLNIISFSNSLLKRYLDKWAGGQKIPYLDNIQIAVKQISSLLDDLVFLGKSEVGQLNFEPKPTTLNVFCRELTTQMKPMSDARQQSLNFVDRSRCQEAWVDTDLLNHIFTNLLANAIKYSPDGSTINFELDFEAEQVVFSVQDRGIGISAEDQQRLFEPFYRGSNVDDIPGTGLGLAIVSNLVQTHGGKIEVESEIGAGTTFKVTLPAANQPSTTNHQP
ncbi:MAG: ATP-binding protein [Cyanophyceae cyanobacterium]